MSDSFRTAATDSMYAVGKSLNQSTTGFFGDLGGSMSKVAEAYGSSIGHPVGNGGASASRDAQISNASGSNFGGGNIPSATVKVDNNIDSDSQLQTDTGSRNLKRRASLLDVSSAGIN